jgi:uncharacterized protein (DUF1697 family)
VFSSSSKATGHTVRIQSAIQEEFDQRILTFTMAAAQFLKIAKGNPFLRTSDINEAFLHVTFLFEEPSEGLEADSLAKAGDEDVTLANGHLYLYCPHGYGRTKLNNSYFERLLKTPATTRNWRTVQALQDLIEKQ